MNRTSACGWRARCNHGTREGTAAAKPWLEHGYRYKYQWLFARAVQSLAEKIQEANVPARAMLGNYVFQSPSGPWRQGLVGLASSYPTLATARDITSLRGNAPGPDHMTYYGTFQCPYGDQELRELRRRLRTGSYRPGGLRRTGFRQGTKVRTLHIPNLIDRVAERAIVLALQVPCEFLFHPRSYGFRPWRTTAHAFGELKRILHATGSRWLGKADQKDAFDRIPHRRLLDIVQFITGDSEMTELVSRIVRRPAWRNKQGKDNIGLPQGGPLSPLLFNVYVNHFVDQRLAQQYPEIIFLRWADDTLLVCESEEQLREHRRIIGRVYEEAGLALNEAKSAGPDAQAQLQDGETIEYLGLKVGFGSNDLNLDLTEESVLALWDQLFLDIVEQQPNVGWVGRREYIRRQILHTTTSWLDAYAGAISETEWPGFRKGVTRWVTETLPKEIRQVPGPTGHLPVECPKKADLTDAFIKAKGKWDARISAPIPTFTDIYILQQRDAHARTIGRALTPASIADGADLVPAPLTQVLSHCDTNPGPDGVEVSVGVADLPW